MDASQLITLHADLTSEKRNIVIQQRYLEMVEWDYVAAVVFRDLIAFTGWSYSKRDRDGWFYRTEADWQESAHLSQKQVNRCIAHINTVAGEEVIEKKIKKIVHDNGTMMQQTATHYRVNPEAFARFYKASVDADGGSRNFQLGDSGNGEKGDSPIRPEGESLTYTQQTTQQTEQDGASEDARALADLESSFRNRKKKSTQSAGSGARDDARVWGLVSAYFEGRGMDDHKMPASQRSAAYNVLKDLGPEWSQYAVRACTQYLGSQQWYQEPGRLTAKAVVAAIHDWDNKGRPTMEAPRVAQKPAFAFASSMAAVAERMKEHGL